ncbi:MAG TPA: DVUA0089 family protein, partial [Phycisphaerales bacterium]|nr:DVUA0089 family protein [Phycisphaerales bacterium]
AAIVLIPAAFAGGGTWAESGDAPQALPGNLTSGSGQLSSITGAFGGGGQDADIYCIRITNPAAFSATTVGGSAIDTQLFLFDSNGRGVTFNDDGANAQSTITGQLVPAAGTYYLAIAPYDYDPRSAAGDIWADTPFNTQRAPDGSGAAGVLSSWTGTSTATGAYAIAITGAEFFVDSSLVCPPHMAAAVHYPGNQADDVTLADMNRDGRPDLVFAQRPSVPTVMLRLATGDGAFGPAAEAISPNLLRGYGVADMNRDGLLDIYSNSSTQLRIAFQTATGTFATTFQYQLPDVGTSGVADVNRDGVLDLVSTLVTGDIEVVRRNASGAVQGAGTFGPASTNPRGFLITDLDRNGTPDVALCGANEAAVIVMRGNGDGTFTAGVAYPAGFSPSRVAAADFNADGRTDLAVTGESGGSVRVLLGNGDGSFQAPLSFAISAGPDALAVGVAAGDVNGDGRADLAVADSVSNTVSVLLGLGNGTFAPPALYTVAASPLGVAVGDLNGDGRADLVTANGSGGGVSVLLQLPGAAVPTITQNPAVASVQPGGNASFTVAATGATSYQWRKNGVPIINGFGFAGAQSPTLSITAAIAAQAAAYDVVITNACGSTTSSPAPLFVGGMTTGCLADLGVQGGTPGQDGQLNNNDFIVFIDHFFNQTGCP